MSKPSEIPNFNNPNQSATEDNEASVLTTGDEDQDMLDTYPNRPTPEEASSGVPAASNVSGSGVVSVLLNQLSEVHAPQSLFTLGKSSEGRGSVTRSHDLAFSQQVDPCKVAKLGGSTDAKTIRAD